MQKLLILGIMKGRPNCRIFSTYVLNHIQFVYMSTKGSNIQSWAHTTAIWTVCQGQRIYSFS